MFGQTTQHTDIAGRVTDYLYTYNGLLKQQGNTFYSYYNNGLLRDMVDTENGTRGYYEYDANGNRTFDGYTGKSGNWAFQQSVAEYDALNRLVKVTDPRYNIVYEYDAVGNRIHMVSTYNDAFGQPNQVQDYWYAYDAMNRFTTTMGVLSNGRGSSATDTSTYVYQGTSGDGVSIAYNTFGERVIATYAYDGHTESYAYDAQGYLTTTTLKNQDGSLMGIAVRENDLAGRVIHYIEYDANRFVTQEVWHTWDNDSLLLQDKVIAWDINAKDDNGNIAPRYTITTTTTHRLADGTVSSTYADYDSKNDGSSPHTYITTTYDYVWFDSAKQSTIKVQASNQDVKGWAPGLSAFEYDSFGRIKAAYDVEGGRGFAYQTDGEGRILQRDELLGTYNEQTGKIDNATSNRWHAYYYLDDRQIGNVGNDGVERIDYAQELAQRNFDNSDASHKRFRPVAGADFDSNYTPINSLYPTAAPGSYIVHAGDTLTSIAQALWGDSSLWWLLADANGLSLNEPLIANTVLTVPNKVTNIHNNSSTFKPYDAGKAIGNTNPTIPDAPPPPQPKGGGCGGALQIIAIVVAVVATAVTAGAAITALAPAFAGAGLGATAASIAAGVVGGAIGGAVGSIASQGVLIAGGAQNGFNWKGVAINALSAGVTYGTASAFGAGAIGSATTPGGAAAEVARDSGNFFGAVARGATAGAANNVLGSVTGLQSFSWKNIAASAVAAGVSYGLNKVVDTQLPKSVTNNGGFQLARDYSSNLAGNVAYTAATGQSVSRNLDNLLYSAAGQTLGNSIAGSIADRSKASSQQSSASKLSAAAIVRSGDALPNIAISARDIVSPIAFEAQPLEVDPYKLTFADIGPVVLSSPFDGVTGSAQTTYTSFAGVRGDAVTYSRSSSQVSLSGVRGDVLPASDLSAPSNGFATWGRGVDEPQPHIGNASLQNLGLYDWLGAGNTAAGTTFAGVQALGEKGFNFGVSLARPAIYDSLLVAGGGKGINAIPTVIELYTDAGRIASSPLTKTFGVNLSKAVPAMKMFGLWSSFAAPGIEGFSLLNQDKPVDGGDIGHFAVTGGVSFGLSKFGLPGALLGADWTILDTSAQSYHYTPAFGGNAGKYINGWRAVWATGSDNREFGIQKIQRESSGLTHEQAAGMYDLIQFGRQSKYMPKLP
ncbi:LysM peptidoglycan-binding domain-containing protein [Dyella acidisoli]|uniref:LysM domain-containing protein n=1 Tax=Dyella acidisoli TaxID=1867834 RepID=A0ABQ5XLR5_9GAMM|nr:LysM peptidoglycan-binding domain-containing protein [Dyella acidisoli]GLQ92639.1 hypothetical protein GCM10007901_15900 [Dyella acidisoli]